MTNQSAPYTGDEYLASIRGDGREVWIGGQRVVDVTSHPAFRNSARMTARLYDALHDPDRRDLLTIPLEGEGAQGSRTHRFFQQSQSVAELISARDAIAEWARITFGWMGRSPDFKASWSALLRTNAALSGEFNANAERWYEITRKTVPFLGHAYVNPPVDRHLPLESVDVNIRVEKETDAGLVVSGAKVVATGAALTHCVVIGHFHVAQSDKRFSPVFITPTNTSGVKLICRASYEYNASLTGSPFDAPLSSRLDENDSILILDKVLVPWENVIMYGVEAANQFYTQPGFFSRALLQGCTRLAVKVDFITGLLMRALEITGAQSFRGAQASVGEILGIRNTLWALSDAMSHNATLLDDESVVPNLPAAIAARIMAPDFYSRVINIIQKTVASALIYLPSSAADFNNPTLRGYLDKYVRGSNGVNSVERVKVLKLLWDAIGTEFGSRHELYELNYAGGYEACRVDAVMMANATGLADDLKGFAESCMKDYDLDGWTAPDLASPHGQRS